MPKSGFISVTIKEKHLKAIQKYYAKLIYEDKLKGLEDG